ncbi:hypothetical protein CMQ_2538 [Grosmannia clavigera kw1407]|uniref:Tyrosine specific protein phosphatases domain-containing protein n=1 Tax=Grosmannia clavigera (strain kw1407 / UAMH 11150) TaxID=655863 RepID=F0XI08_GROCL|nr:uncharacterized protein CMQ_2538 [Grosmannia clavigera kw1407]EFX02609.1 hypothetical protein CMQ_2538 [Grosmannia clavigera kw1407]
MHILLLAASIPQKAHVFLSLLRGARTQGVEPGLRQERGREAIDFPEEWIAREAVWRVFLLGLLGSVHNVGGVSDAAAVLRFSHSEAKQERRPVGLIGLPIRAARARIGCTSGNVPTRQQLLSLSLSSRYISRHLVFSCPSATRQHQFVSSLADCPLIFRRSSAVFPPSATFPAMAVTALSASELLTLCEQDVSIKLTPEQLAPVLSTTPFIVIEGTFNARDIGRVPRSEQASQRLRPGFAFRSGGLSRLTDGGKATIAELGVRRIFDLRSQSEHATAPDPVVSETVTLVWEKPSKATPHVTLEPFAEGFGEAGYAAMYLDVLDSYSPSFRVILEHVRDRPEEPFLFHCTAGRDRTGVTAALLQTLAGEPAEIVALDYVLSRLGNEPVREDLERFARSGAGVLATSTVAAEDVDLTAPPPPGFDNLLNLRVRCLKAFLDALDEQYGPNGFVGYAKSLGFSDADLATIKTNLTAAP